MAKLLYCLKIYLFRNEFEIDEKDNDGFREISVFIVLLYAELWFAANEPEKAVSNDLKFLHGLLNCCSVKKEVRDAAFRKFSDHLWYFSEHLIDLAFFDNIISVECKRKMTQALEENSGTKNPLKRISLNTYTNTEIATLTIDKFVTCNTMLFFKILDICTDFLDDDPSTWEFRTDCQKRKLCCLKFACHK